jgi:transposase
MSDLYWLTDEQMARLEPYFPKSHGKPRVDDRRVLSGIVFVNRNGLRWCDAPKEYGPHKTLYNRWKRWGERGVFVRIMEGLAAASATPKTIMIDATYLKAHRTASSLRVKKGALGASSDVPKVSDYTGAAALLDDLPAAQWMLGDRGYDADWYRDALQAKGITPCIPGRKSRIMPVKYDKRRYRSRSRIEIMFGRLKDWRRVATRYDRCPTVFFSAVALAATVIFWL